MLQHIIVVLPSVVCVEGGFCPFPPFLPGRPHFNAEGSSTANHTPTPTTRSSPTLRTANNTPVAVSEGSSTTFEAGPPVPGVGTSPQSNAGARAPEALLVVSRDSSWSGMGGRQPVKRAED